MLNIVKALALLSVPLFLPQISFAEPADESPRISVTSSASDVLKLMRLRVYEENGPRAGRFFEDYNDSANEYRAKWLNYYEEQFVYQIADWSIPDAVSLAAGKPYFGRDLFPYQTNGVIRESDVAEFRASLNDLLISYRNRKIQPAEFKRVFIDLMAREYDRRTALVAASLRKCVERNDGSYNAMLDEYQRALVALQMLSERQGLEQAAGLLPYVAAGTAIALFL